MSTRKIARLLMTVGVIGTLIWMITGLGEEGNYWRGLPFLIILVALALWIASDAKDRFSK